MDKTTSVLAAFEAGKVPSTQQTNQFIDWLNNIGITQVEPTANNHLSAQGRVLANDLRRVLDAYKQLGSNKNSDNILQQAIWHLTEGDLTVTSEAEADKDQLLADLNAIRSALRNLLSILWSSVSSEGTSLLQDILSLIRLSLADAAQVIEGRAGQAKDTLRRIDTEVQEGTRDPLGREKKQVEQEKDFDTAWKHGVEAFRDAGSSAIGTAKGTSASVHDKASQTTPRFQDAFYRISDRAQSNPEYGKALDTILNIFHRVLNRSISAAADPKATFESFITDPTPEQHVPKALELIRTLISRLANTPLDPLINKLHACAAAILEDERLNAWFDDFFVTAKKHLSESGYARSEEAQSKRNDLHRRWATMLEEDDKWKKAVENVKKEFTKIQTGLENDDDLIRVKDAHAVLGMHIEEGLMEAGHEAQTDMQAAIEQATWFWQDLFKVYIPNVLSKMRDIPIPRTEFKDSEIEFVLENLDISSFNILPSHVYIRNITDIDIQTPASPSAASRTSVGTLTHIRIQAAQLTLKDVSFWYKDKQASALGPKEFTGLLALKLPEKGVDVDLKVRMIPATTKGSLSRESLKHFNIIERAEVSISDEVGIDIHDTNHSVLVTLLRPIMVSRLRDALEKTLTEQLRAIIDYADGVAFDVSKRRQVFEDTGLGGGGSLMAALWSEVGRLERESRLAHTELGWKATGTGIVVEHSTTSDDSSGEVKKSAFAMGAEPQILSGEKHGPLGTGSEMLRDKFERVGDEFGLQETMHRVNPPTIDVGVGLRSMEQTAKEFEARAKGMYHEGQRRVSGFRRTVERKSRLEKGQPGWESASFDF